MNSDNQTYTQTNTRDNLLKRSFSIGKIGAIFAILTPLSSLTVFLIIIPIPIVSPFLYLFGYIVPLFFAIIGEILLVSSIVLSLVGMLKSKISNVAAFIAYIIVGLLTLMELPFLYFSGLMAQPFMSSFTTSTWLSFVVYSIILIPLQSLYLLGQRQLLPRHIG